MADSVTVGQDIGPYYTWDNQGATLTWDGTFGANTSWDYTRDASFTVAAAVAFGLTDASPVFAITRRIAETIPIAELLAMSYVLPQSEQFRAADPDRLWWNASDSWATVPGTWGNATNLLLATDYLRDFASAFGLGESFFNIIGSKQGEAIKVTDGQAFAFAQALTESVAFAELMGRVVSYKRAVDEGFGVQEAIAKAVALRRDEYLAILDELRRNSDATISDMLVGLNDMSEEDFAKLLTQAQPVGYGPFKSFMEGDHEYSSAIFKAVITATDGKAARLSDLTVNVDVPDLKDSGSASITASQPLHVAFTRGFNAPPEVKVGLKGGAGFAVPRVSNITEGGFDLELVDVNNNPVGGTVAWHAVGY